VTAPIFNNILHLKSQPTLQKWYINAGKINVSRNTIWNQIHWSQMKTICTISSLETTGLVQLYVTTNMKDIGSNRNTTVYINTNNCQNLTSIYT